MSGQWESNISFLRHTIGTFQFTNLVYANNSVVFNEITFSAYVFLIAGALAWQGDIIDTQLYAWTMIIVFPINSAINPMIYFYPVLSKKLVTRIHSFKLYCFYFLAVPPNIPIVLNYIAFTFLPNIPIVLNYIAFTFLPNIPIVLHYNYCFHFLVVPPPPQNIPMVLHFNYCFYFPLYPKTDNIVLHYNYCFYFLAVPKNR